MQSIWPYGRISCIRNRLLPCRRWYGRRSIWSAQQERRKALIFEGALPIIREGDGKDVGGNRS